MFYCQQFFVEQVLVLNYGVVQQYDLVIYDYLYQCFLSNEVVEIVECCEGIDENFGEYDGSGQDILYCWLVVLLLLGNGNQEQV